jgi:hypothetical protein
MKPLKEPVAGPEAGKKRLIASVDVNARELTPFSG